MYIFLDESGNFTRKKGDYFVVGGFVTGDPRRTAKAFRKWQHTKFSNKKLRYRTEVKFSDTRLTDELRAKTLLYFTKQDIRIFYSFLKKENIPLEFRKRKGLDSGHLYTEIIAQTLELLLPSPDLEFRAFSDKRHLKRLSQSEFRELLTLLFRKNFLKTIGKKNGKTKNRLLEKVIFCREASFEVVILSLSPHIREGNTQAPQKVLLPSLIILYTSEMVCQVLRILRIFVDKFDLSRNRYFNWF